MREESEEFKTTEEDNVYSGEPKKNEGRTLAGYRESIFAVHVGPIQAIPDQTLTP